jgi:hypothetical protein
MAAEDTTEQDQNSAPSLTEMIERNLMWAEALEANNGKECRESMRSPSEGTRCCLAVAEDVYLEVNGCVFTGYDLERFFPDKKVADWFGWSPTSDCSGLPPLNNSNPFIGEFTAVTLNDDLALSHQEIAERVRKWVQNGFKPQAE